MGSDRESVLKLNELYVTKASQLGIYMNSSDVRECDLNSEGGENVTTENRYVNAVKTRIDEFRIDKKSAYNAE